MANKIVNLNQKELQNVAGGKLHVLNQALILMALIGAYRSLGVYQDGKLTKLKGVKNIAIACVSEVWQDTVFYGGVLTIVGAAIG